jgi:hypothetical protein
VRGEHTAPYAYVWSIAASPRADKSGDGAFVTAVTIGKNLSTAARQIMSSRLNAGACAPAFNVNGR